MKKYLFFLLMTMALTPVMSQTVAAKEKPSYSSEVSIDEIILNAKAEDDGSSPMLCTVNLEWFCYSNGNVVPKTCYLYIVDEWDNYEPVLDSEGRQVTGEYDEEYCCYTYSFEVERRAEEYTINFVVADHPWETLSDNSTVYSEGYGSVTISPYGPDVARFVIGVRPVSDYNYDAYENEYKNYVSLSNAFESTVLYSNFLDAEKNPEFTFYRYDGEEKVKVATVNIESWGGSYLGENTYSYRVTYDNQMSGADESAYPAKTGTFTSYGDCSEVYFGDFQVCDQFSVSTYSNNHPDNYWYGVEFVNKDTELSSGLANVKVYKTTTVAPKEAFTFDDVECDSIATKRLMVKDINSYLSFSTENDRNICFYSVSKQIDGGSWTELNRAVRTDDGNYEVNEDGKSSIYGSGQRATVNSDESGYGRHSLIPVIHTERQGAAGEYNTYGGPVENIYRVGVTAQETHKEMSKYTFTGEDGRKGRYYKTAMNIAAHGVTLDGQIVRYRVWRKTENEDDAMEVLPEYKNRLNWDTHPADMYVNRGWPYFNANCKNDFTIHENTVQELQPSAIDQTTISFTDVFGARTLEGKDLNVAYLIRMYSLPEPGIELAPSSRSAYINPDEKYYISDAVVSVTFSEDVFTSIDDIDAAGKTPLSVKYSNLMGMVSDEPFSGINIVVTTYTDGTTKSEKKMY